MNNGFNVSALSVLVCNKAQCKSNPLLLLLLGARKELYSSVLWPPCFLLLPADNPRSVSFFLLNWSFLYVASQLQDHVTLVNPGVSQLCIRGDGKLLASAGWDHRVRVFGWKKLRPLAVLQYHSDMVQSVAFSDHQDPQQRLLAAGSKDQRISLWSIYNEGV